MTEDYAAIRAFVRERLAWSPSGDPLMSDAADWVFEHLAGTAKTARERRQLATEILNAAFEVMLIGLSETGVGGQLDKGAPRLPLLNLSRAQLLDYINLLIQNEAIPLGDSFDADDLRKLWNDEASIHDALIRYIYRP